MFLSLRVMLPLLFLCFLLVFRKVSNLSVVHLYFCYYPQVLLIFSLFLLKPVVSSLPVLHGSLFPTYSSLWPRSTFPLSSFLPFLRIFFVLCLTFHTILLVSPPFQSLVLNSTIQAIRRSQSFCWSFPWSLDWAELIP